MEMPPSECGKCGNKKLKSETVYHGVEYSCPCGWHTYVYHPNMYREDWEPEVYGAEF